MLAVLSLLMLANPLPTASAYAANAAEVGADLQKTLSLLSQRQDPVARKLLVWLYATESNLPIHAPDLIAFTRNNKSWPRQHTIRLKIEENIAGTVSTADTITWFNENPPETVAGIKAYMQALLTTQQTDRARHTIKTFWQKSALSQKETTHLIGLYQRFLDVQDHAQRVDRMIWDGRYSEAEALLPFSGPDTRATAKARIALARMSRDANPTVQALNATQLKNEGVMFERLRWRRRMNLDAGALEILDEKPAQPKEPDAWWGEMNILSRRMIEKRDYKAAYDIIKRHKMTEGGGYAQAEWQLGWIELRFLQKPSLAYGRFAKLFDNVNASISKSRAAYWAGRAAEAMPDQIIAAEWHKKAAAYTSTFYGQLSYAKVYGAPRAGTFQDPVPTAEMLQAFEQKETVRAVRLLHKAGMTQFIDPFLARLTADAQTRTDYMLSAKLARETERFYYAVQTNKDIQMKTGMFLPGEGYPVLPPLPLQSPEKALVHSIIYRESMFNPKALSPAGARGLMQLMPGTAKDLSRKIGVGYSADKLILDARYNVLLGSTYLGQMLERYDGFYPMAIAAYNAGPGRVDSWIRDFGDPRKGDMDLIDWLEHIPIYETRNYVQRVMESYYMYRLRFNEAPRTVLDKGRP